MAADSFPSSLPPVRWKLRRRHVENTAFFRALQGNSTTRVLSDTPEWEYDCLIHLGSRAKIELFYSFYAHIGKFGAEWINITIPTPGSRAETVEGRILDAKPESDLDVDSQIWAFKLITQQYLPPLTEAQVRSML